MPESSGINAALCRQKRAPNLHIHVWYRAPTGEYRPTKRGITIPLSAAPYALAAIATLVPDAVEAWLAGEVAIEEVSTSNGSVA